MATRRTSGTPKKKSFDETRREMFRAMVSEAFGINPLDVTAVRQSAEKDGIAYPQLLGMAKRIVYEAEEFSDSAKQVGILLLAAEPGLKLNEVTATYADALLYAETYWENRFDKTDADPDFLRYKRTLDLRMKFENEFYPFLNLGIERDL
jgi:hypothetical protein